MRLCEVFDVCSWGEFRSKLGAVTRAFGLRLGQIMPGLDSDPELGRRSKIARKPQRGVGGNSALAVDDGECAQK
jgi:hypothetical protein